MNVIRGIEAGAQQVAQAATGTVAGVAAVQATESVNYLLYVSVALAAAGGAIANVLLSAKRGGQPLDLLVDGFIAFFIGVTLWEPLAGFMAPLIPGGAELSAVPAAALVSLFGVEILEKVILKRFRKNIGDESADEKSESEQKK
jgi:hypothetical protein